MEDQESIIVLRAQFYLPREVRRRMNYFWALTKQPKNEAIEMKVRKMKRNIICRASNCAADVYDHWMEFVENKQYLLPELKSLEAIKEQIQAGIFRPFKLKNAIYSRMLEEAADAQFVAAEEEAAAKQFMEETVEAAERAKQAARATLAAEEATAAARFANEAAEAAQVAKVAAESALLAKLTKETYENAKVAEEAEVAAEFAKKTAAAAQLLAEAKATPEAVVVEAKLAMLSL